VETVMPLISNRIDGEWVNAARAVAKVCFGDSLGQTIDPSLQRTP
jgi:hypothetical protein